MDDETRTLFAARTGDDRTASYEALVTLFARTDAPVDWAYEVWDGLRDDLRSRDPHARAFAAQLLWRLAKSDPDGRMYEDFPAVFAVTRDERFVTARHVLQASWRVGLAGPELAARVIAALTERFRECGDEKNASLIRTDIVAALRHLHDAVEGTDAESAAETLIAGETDEKMRKKLRTAWRQPG